MLLMIATQRGIVMAITMEICPLSGESGAASSVVLQKRARAPERSFVPARRRTNLGSASPCSYVPARRRTSLGSASPCPAKTRSRARALLRSCRRCTNLGSASPCSYVPARRRTTLGSASPCFSVRLPVAVRQLAIANKQAGPGSSG